MSLKDLVQHDMTSALKAKDEKKVKTLRMLFSAIKNEEIDKRPNKLEEKDVLGVIKREVKKLNDAIVQFREGGREDLAKEYEEEIEIIKKYVPKGLSEEEIKRIIEEKIETLKDKNFGNVMKEVMLELKGSADGGLVSRLVKEELEKN